MFVNERVKSVNLCVMESLHHRMDLTWAQEQYYQYQVRGYEGEVLFDKILQVIEKSSTIFANITLHQSGTDFEMDTIVVRGETLHVYDIKNFRGEFRYEEGQLLTSSGTRITDPASKIDRTEILLTNFLKRHGLNYQVKAHIVYIHDEHTMFHAPKNDNIIYRSQIKQHLRTFAAQDANTYHDHSRLMKVLLENNISDYRSKDIPEYQYHDLKKGFWCPFCGSFDFHHTREKMNCQQCGDETQIQKAITRNAREFQLLFPDEKMTTAKVHDWCAQEYSTHRVKYALLNNFKKMGKNKGTYFI